MTRRSTATQLSFSLHSAANRMVRLHKPILEPLGLTFPQYLVVLELLDGGPRTVGALGAALDMDTGTITPWSSAWKRRGGSPAPATPGTNAGSWST